MSRANIVFLTINVVIIVGVAIYVYEKTSSAQDREIAFQTETRETRKELAQEKAQMARERQKHEKEMAKLTEEIEEAEAELGRLRLKVREEGYSPRGKVQTKLFDIETSKPLARYYKGEDYYELFDLDHFFHPILGSELKLVTREAAVDIIRTSKEISTLKVPAFLRLFGERTGDPIRRYYYDESRGCFETFDLDHRFHQKFGTELPLITREVAATIRKTSDTIHIKGYGFEVPATEPWPQRTGIRVPARSVLVFEAWGTVSPNGSARTGVAGTDGWEIYNIYKKAKHCSLIGKVGEDGDIFPIRSESEIKIPHGGDLFLGVNDQDVHNNDGAFFLNVDIWPMYGLCGSNP